MTDTSKSKDQEMREGSATPATDELKASEETVDPRLDNRVGDQRPPLEKFPAKPQQVDGPDVTQRTPRPNEVAKATPADMAPKKGMSSPGPHGLGDTEPVPFDEAVKSDDTITTKKDSK